MQTKTAKGASFMFSSNKFQDLLKFFPQEIFKKSVIKYGGDRYVKNFSCKSQLVAMIYAQISGSCSLREIENGFNPHAGSNYHLHAKNVCKSTLSDANATRDYRIFMESAQHLMSQFTRKNREDFGDIIRLIDSSPISLIGRGFDGWTESNKTQRTQGLKLHMECDLSTFSPTYFSFSAANVNDITESKKWGYEQGITYVFDKGYFDYNWWWSLHQSGAFFVTRLKKNSSIKVVSNQMLSGENADEYILADERIILANKSPRGGKKNEYGEELRRVTVNRPDKETPLILVTNRFDLTASAIAELYKQRWQIELLFKWLKQHLKIKKFVGRSENAVKIQIIVAIITYMLVMLLKKASQCQLSMFSFLIIIRTTLFQRIKTAKPPDKCLKMASPHSVVNRLQIMQMCFKFSGQ